MGENLFKSLEHSRQMLSRDRHQHRESFERGLRAALSAVKSVRWQGNMNEDESSGWWARGKADERAIERLMKGDDGDE